MSKEIRTIDASIARLTDALLSDYQKGRAIDRIEPFSQPDREVIIALIGKMKRLLFPGYFRDPSYRIYNMKHSLAALMEDTAYHLGQQIAIALRLGEAVDDARARELDAHAQELTVRFLERLPEVRALLQTDLSPAPCMPQHTGRGQTGLQDITQQVLRWSSTARQRTPGRRPSWSPRRYGAQRPP